MQRIFNKIKYLIHIFRSYFYYKDQIKLLDDTKNKKRIILFCTPEHGNLGDHAIAIAQHKFLKDNYPKIKIIEVTSAFFLKKKEKIKEFINNDDILIISGGGFLGSLWLDEENIVREIIYTFKENKIIIFPQTIFFEKNDFGKEELKKSKEIYLKHKNLYIAIRDENSILEAEKLINNKDRILYVPDIVLYLEGITFQKDTMKNNDVLICLRKDKEKIRDNKIDSIISKLKNSYSIKYTDTVINSFIFPYEREKYVKDKMQEFGNSKIVITDRLHGMIFSFLTKTPCIALNNSSGKVLGVYEWIKECVYIKIVDNIEEIPSLINILLNQEIKNITLDEKWIELKNFLNKEI